MQVDITQYRFVNSFCVRIFKHTILNMFFNRDYLLNYSILLPLL